MRCSKRCILNVNNRAFSLQLDRAISLQLDRAISLQLNNNQFRKLSQILKIRCKYLKKRGNIW